MTAWKEQNWKETKFDFSECSDRVTLKLEVGQVVYIPGAADISGCKSKTGAQKLLDKMIKNGLIRKAGKGPAIKYII